MRFPWGPKARARRQAQADARQQAEQREQAFARIAHLARSNWDTPTTYLPRLQSAPLLTRAQNHRANRRR